MTLMQTIGPIMWSFLFFVVVAAHANPTEPLKVVKSYKELLECPKESKLVDQEMCCKIQPKNSAPSEVSPKCIKHGPSKFLYPGGKESAILFYLENKPVGPRYKFDQSKLIGAWDSPTASPEVPRGAKTGRVLLMYESGEVFSRGTLIRTGDHYFEGEWEVFSPAEKAKYVIDFQIDKNSFSRCQLPEGHCQSINDQFVSREELATAKVKPIKDVHGLFLKIKPNSYEKPQETLAGLPGMVKLDLTGSNKNIVGVFLGLHLVTRWSHLHPVNYGYTVFKIVSERKDGWCRVNLLTTEPTWVWIPCHDSDVSRFSEDAEEMPAFPSYVQPVSSESVKEQPGSKQAMPWTPALSKLAFDDLQMGIREIRVVRKDGQWWITGEIDSPYLGELESRFQYDSERLALYKKTDITKIRRREVTFPVSYKGNVNVKQLSSDEFDGGF